MEPRKLKEKTWEEQVEKEIGLLHEKFNTLEQNIARGVASGIEKVIADEAVVKRFWETGFQHLSKHATDQSSQWIGRRILTFVAVAIVGAIVTWLVKSGAIK